MALAGITMPNDPSVAFHAALGFEEFARYKNVGYKFGKWCDTAWSALDLFDGKEDVQPQELIPVGDLTGTEIWKAAIKKGLKLIREG